MIQQNMTSWISARYKSFTHFNRIAYVIGALFITLFLYQPALAESSSDAKGTSLSNECFVSNLSIDIPLLGSYSVDPCELTRDRRDLEFAQKYYGGEQFMIYLNEWMDAEFIPALKDQTKQEDASRINQTMQLGTAQDAQNIAQNIQAQQTLKLNLAKDNQPSEQACVAASNQAALSAYARTSKAITKALKNELNMRANNDVKSDAEGGPASEQALRWQTYCEQFHDPRNNNGISACPEPLKAGKTPNSDIDVESFMFRDTIDMYKEDEQKTAYAMLVNLIQPRVQQKLPEEVLNSATGQEWILKHQHVQAARNLISDVMNDILSRRTGLPSISGVAPLPDDDGTPPPPPPVGGTGYEAYLAALRRSESGNNYANDRNTMGCHGAYQYCPGTLKQMGCVTWGCPGSRRSTSCSPSHSCKTSTPKVCTIPDMRWTGTCGGVSGINSVQDFYNSRAAQDGLQRQTDARTLAFIKKNNLDKYIGKKDAYGQTITMSGMMAAAHLGGPGGLRSYLRNHKNPSDGNTKISDYMRRFGGYDVSDFDDTIPPPDDDDDNPDDEPPPPPPPTAWTNTGEFIRDIRLKAGIPKERISDNPSYNEIMLAMTKERYYDPAYFVRMKDSIGAIKQEQTAISNLIAVQYQDIYKLQEQINALLASRAAIKINAEPKSNMIESAPLR